MFPIRYSSLEECRQGDPISPYLFVMAAEILAESIRVNNAIKGITLFGKEFNISQYADDTSLYIQPDEKSHKECMECLSDFEYASGLKVNIDKTKVVKIGGWRDSRIILCSELNLIWRNKFESL